MSDDTHLSLDRILRYFSGEMNEYELESAEMHLGTCEACALRARRAYPLTEGWTPERHAAAVEGHSRAADPLTAALMRAKQLYTALESSIEAWLKSPAAMWSAPDFRVASFAGAATPISGAKTELLRITLPLGTTRARIAANRPLQDVQVHFDWSGDPAHAPAAILFADDEAVEPVVVSATRATDGRGWIARFPDTTGGEYFFAAEPRT
jgi:hypothetical protein